MKPNPEKIADAMLDDARALMPTEFDPIDFDSFGERGKVVAYGLIAIVLFALLFVSFLIWDAM